MPRKKTHEEYCEQINKFNKNIEVIDVYINSSTPIKHKCPICKGNWVVRPSDVLLGKATKCNRCYGNYKKSQEEYVLEINNINSEIKVIGEYQGAHIPILHMCPFCKRDDWLVAPNTLLSEKAYGCNECGIERTKNKLTRTNEEYIMKLNDLNINIRVIGKYIDANTKIAHECPECKNEWMIMPNDILQGVRTCLHCRVNATYTHQDYLDALKDKGIDIEVIGTYVKVNEKLLHKCPDCGESFNVQPASILSKKTKRCHACKKTKLKTHEDYIQEVNLLELKINVIGKYSGYDIPIYHECVICNRKDWLVTPASILHGCKMCADCRNKQFESLHATVLKQIWKYYYSDTIWEDPSCINPKTKRPLETDIVNHELKISIEIQSDYHDTIKQQNKDIIKKDYWEGIGYKHYQLDIRDYTILEMINIFFPDVLRIPEWIDITGKITSRNWSILEAQQLLDNGYTIKKIAKKLKTTRIAISSAIYADLLIKPNTYKNDVTHLMKPIVQLDLNGCIVKEYAAIRDTDDFGFNSSSIVYACKGKYKNGSHKHKGYFWYYKTDYILIQNNKEE